ncbi:choloylglycine hydrolase [Photobacterium angustum]|uniref:choloylglycine hydrolase family protein n=1 Tax=Photobacterium angustum TaxID=661 RepID=UPI0005EA5B4C|nr:choloylglycine hydrolase family protein [Photobacterium angustum]KJF96164.1 choloylglycine hydrolase [Photobacterium angustum]KJG02877.1 choloylglycine hydrolase [Photobacterium angustum]KJG06613.1 choloylglycine hydrolase [Photobacterium angustum]PSV65725.1 linear amide C-N hydrolase [Photobacterium angustum]PSV91625.1 linear amide C-N hydrolase [Photobacterium angustum]
MKKFLLPLCIGMAITSLPAAACTGIVLKSDDGVTIPARTMEFGFDVESDIAMVPAGTEIKSLSSNPDKTGLVYKAKYGFGGANAFDRNIIVDGMNEKGLYYGAFYFAGVAKYSELTKENQAQAVSSEELGNYILANFANIDEVKKGLEKITVVGTLIKEIGGIAPLHYAVTDAKGDSIVIEYSKDGLKIHVNKLGVVTNPPSYDWHETHVRNFIGLSPENTKPIEINGVKLTGISQGTGMVGLPGDYTSPSRFVRAVTFVNSSLPSKNADEAVFRAFHILNAFDIPKGLIVENTDDGDFHDYTVWTSVSDTKNKDYYFKTYLTPQHMKLNIVDALKGLKAPKIIEMESTHTYNDITGQFSQK